MSKYRINGLPWGSGIGKDVSDCHSSQEVMEKAGLNFYVDKCDLVAKMPFSLNGNNKINEINYKNIIQINLFNHIINFLCVLSISYHIFLILLISTSYTKFAVYTLHTITTML